jgi:uncharacterized protein YdhG (YjbR/CyaY superfamily)
MAQQNSTTTDDTTGFTAAERAAMKERAKEVKASSRRSSRAKPDGESDLLAKIAEMPDADRTIAERIHAIVKANAPGLAPKTWYGMPAYAKDGAVVCFFTAADKFKSRYATFGFNDSAHLDDGTIWPTSFAIKEMTPEVESRLTELVKKAVS